MRRIEQPVDVSITPESNPAYYLMHKYWARKPANVVRSYIEYYTQRGDTVLDPFAGSGVTLIEALLANRRAIAVDLNPIACLIMEASVSPVDLGMLQHYYEQFAHDINTHLATLYKTVCRRCGRPATATHFVWGGIYQCTNCKQHVHATDGKEQKRSLHCPMCGSRLSSSAPLIEEELREVWWRCPYCSPSKRVLKAAPLPEDLELASSPPNYDTIKQLPTWPLVPNKRTLVWPGMTVKDLFTPRNYFMLYKIKEYIDSVPETEVRRLFQFVFTSALAQASKLVAFRGGLTTGGPAWTVSGFWIPAVHFEINPWICFGNRYGKVTRGKRKLDQQLQFAAVSPRRATSLTDMASAGSWMVQQQSASMLKDIPEKTIDYIFTDPPYGDSVPYLEYATIWAPWFQMPLNYDEEIVISNSEVRQKNASDYYSRLARAFKEAYRVLKPGAWMSVTFNNRQLEVWDIIIRSIREAGFEVANSVYQVPAVIPVKSQLSRSGTIVGDIILNCHKREPGYQIQLNPAGEYQEEAILEETAQIVGERGEGVPLEIVMRGVILRLLKQPSHLWPKGDIQHIIRSHFLVRDGTVYFHPDAPERSRNWESLQKKLEEIVDKQLCSGEVNEKKIAAAVYSTLRNGRAPSMRDIMDTIRARKAEIHSQSQNRLF